MKYSVLIILLLFQQDLLGQSTFNLSYIDNELNSSGVQVFEYQGFYYLVSRSLYIGEIAVVGTTIRKVDTDGNQLDSTFFHNNGQGFSTYLYDCGMQSDGDLVVVGNTKINGVEHMIIQLVTPNLELVGESVVLPSPYNPNLIDEEVSLIRPYSSVFDENDNLYVASSIYDGNSGENDIFYCKYSSELNLEWQFIHDAVGGQAVYSLAHSSNTLIAFQLGDFNDNENTLNKRLIKIKEDEEGLPYISTNTSIDFPQANHVFENIVEEDGFVLVGTRIDDLALENAPIVFKLNMDGMYQWYSPQSLPFNDENQAYYGVERAHGGGYVCVGMEVEFGDNDQGWAYDMDRYGNLTKHSDVGTVEWQRRFTIIESCDENQSFIDILSTENGYLLFGFRGDYCFDENWENIYPRERSWFVKTDECGCIVPGCGEKDCYIGLEEEKPDQLNILLYPNPSSDYCSIYIPEGFQSQYLQVFNSLGQLIIEKSGLVDDTTYIISVSSWGNGIYILNVVSEGNVIESHKIEVMRR
jgi:hypothetical protein